jgi:hypothetical protein
MAGLGDCGVLTKLLQHRVELLVPLYLGWILRMVPLSGANEVFFSFSISLIDLLFFLDHSHMALLQVLSPYSCLEVYSGGAAANPTFLSIKGAKKKAAGATLKAALRSLRALDSMRIYEIL